MWKAPARIQRFRWLEPFVDSIGKDYDTFVICQVILSSSDPPDAETRAAARRKFQQLENAMRRLVSVPVGDALWMSVVRTIMRGVAIVSGQRKMQTFAADVSEGIDQILAAGSGHTPPRKELERAIFALCEALDVPRSELGAMYNDNASSV